MSFNKNWTKERDQYLRDHYNDKIHVSPAILAMNLHRTLRQVITRMAELGIRKKRSPERW